MWFQLKAPGETATRLLAGPGGVALAARVAEAIHKLHTAGIPSGRTHGIAEELRILRDCLTKVMELKPQLGARVQRLEAACRRLGEELPAAVPCGIHRDFYPAQVLVDGSRLFLIDFDLYCMGDAGLDPGNFIGHLIEQAVREFGDECALGGQIAALEERFVSLSGEARRASLRAYATLTLARHVYLSTQFPEREDYTERLLEACERRLRL
jgi:Ser/Thr protein kinase RdoA (MazF antagonist)